MDAEAAEISADSAAGLPAFSVARMGLYTARAAVIRSAEAGTGVSVMGIG